MAALAEDGSGISISANSSQQSTKLVTFLGKGGSGKTTSAVFAAQVHTAYIFSVCYLLGFCLYLCLVIICGFFS